MDKTTLFIVVILCYFALNLIIGLWGSRSLKVEQITTAKGVTGFIPLTLTLIATIVGGGMFLGVGEMGYNGGLIFLGVGLVYLFGSFMLALLSPHLRFILEKNNTATLFGLLEAVYPSTTKISIKKLFAIACFLVYLVMLGAQFVGISIFYSYFTKADLTKTSVEIAAVAGVGATIVYSVFGGLKKDIVTDCVQMCFIVFGMVTFYYAGNFKYGFIETIQHIPKSDLELRGKYNLIYLIGLLLFIAPTFLARYDIWQRIVTAKNDNVARASFITSGIIAFIAFAAFGMLGLYAKLDGVKDPNSCVLELMETKLSPWPFTFVVVAFFAAIMSSADTFLGVASQSLRNLMWSAVDTEKTERKRLRISGLLVGILSIVFVLVSRSVITYFNVAFGILAIFLPAIIATMYAKRPSKKKAYSSIILGAIGFVATLFLTRDSAFIAGILFSILGYIFTPTEKTRSVSV